MSSLLLDTNALIFCVTDPKQLSKTALAAIQSAKKLYVSAASLWEIDIKHRKAPTEMPVSARAYGAYAREIGIEIIAIDMDVVNALDLLANCKHKDPFDRIIMATSKERTLPLVTKDLAIRRYLKTVIW